MATEKHNVAMGLEMNPPLLGFFFSSVAATFTLLTARARSEIGLAFTFLMEIISKWKSPGRHGREIKKLPDWGEQVMQSVKKFCCFQASVTNPFFWHDVAFI